MKALRVLFLAVAMTALTASIAAAHSQTPRVDRRQAVQHARIQGGVQSGALTRGEAARLRAGQAHVRRVERRAKADGVVTPRERAKLDRKQDTQSRRIARLKHNDRTR
jgi:Spy/CpxP family protein refolding chaperone